MASAGVSPILRNFRGPYVAQGYRIGALELSPPNSKSAPHRYVMVEGDVRLADVQLGFFNASITHRTQYEEMMLRMRVPVEARDLVLQAGLTLPETAEVELASHLVWKGGDENDGFTLHGFVVPSPRIPVDALRDFLPEKEQPSVPPDGHRVIVNFSWESYQSKNSFELLVGIAYYTAKGWAMERLFREGHAHAENLARMFALSVQHRVGIQLIRDRYQAFDYTQTLPVSVEAYFVGSWFRGIHRVIGYLFNTIPAGDLSEVLDIQGDFGSLSIMNPLVVSMKSR